jgi:glucokinase
MSDWVVGVDLGATKIAMGLIDPHDHIVAYRRFATNTHQGPQAVVERIARHVADLQGEIPDGKSIAALGMCSPGPVDHETGMVLDPPNMPGLHHTPLRQMLVERLQLPVSLEHDAKGAALGEYHFGAGRGARSMVYIVVGTGVGAAIIADGDLYRGVNNAAGEIGHTTLDRYGRLCSCGNRGCVETFVSGPWLARHYQEAIQREGQSWPDEQGPITGERVASFAKEGDPLAAQILADAGEALGVAVATMAMMLDIDLYVVGGSVAHCGELLLGPARTTVPRHSHASVGSRVRIVVTELHEDGPILGCGWLARRALDS